MTDVPEAPVGEQPPAEEGRSRRGRPRPTATIERDEAVLASIAEGGSTRNELAEATSLTPQQVYLALWRLRNDGHIARRRDGSVHRWSRVTEAAPQPEPQPVG